VIRSEEESFLETLGTGIDFFDRVVPYVEDLAGKDGEATDEVLGDLQQDGRAMDLLEKAFVDADDWSEILRGFAETAREGQVPGPVAFLLHDTYGFPIDLTQLMARERDLTVDMAGYEDLMERQQQRARAASEFGADYEDAKMMWEVFIPDTEGHLMEKETTFLGYDSTEVENAKVWAYRSLKNEENAEAEILLDKTPFYAEAGGQLGDTGVLIIDGEEIPVVDTQHEDGQWIHRLGSRIQKLEQTKYRPSPEDPYLTVDAIVDRERRQRIRAHHTATHLMHAALRNTLGDHVQQKGSLVAPDRLRFDFSHFNAVEEDTLRDIERQVNRMIQRNILKQEDRDVPYEEAMERGAMALFDEQYGDRVRVITFDPDFSVELCGGTHVDATGEIGYFRFLSEGSVASGVRRVEAVAGPAAVEHVVSELNELSTARRQFASGPDSVSDAITALQEERDALQKRVDQLRQQQLSSQLDTIMETGATTVNDVTVVAGRIEGGTMDDLQSLGQQLRDRLGEGAVGVLCSARDDGEKVHVVATVADDLIEAGRLQAGALVGTLGSRLGGGGGGRPQLASAGGRDTEKLDEVLASVSDLVRDHLS
jgi:alanyl-tRNA synthetase